MKQNLILSLLFCFVICTAFQCRKNSDLAKGCYKGRLEIKGMCSNYTIKVLSAIDTSLVVPNWNNPATGVSYQNVFRLGSPCNFPVDINEGEEFYFTISGDNTGQNCVICQAYYPTPSKSQAITVSKSPCN